MMEGSYNPEAAHRPSASQALRGPRGYKLFKNPPQPHMCIQDSIRGTSEKLYINVMSWKQIGNTRQCADLIPLYGGMQIPHGCTPNCNRPPLIVFAVMVNPEILKVNGKNAPNPQERDALVNLLCDFVEAMNPGLHLTRQPIVLKDRDLAGELKDVWHAVQAHREKEKIRNQEASSEITHKIYHIDGPPERDPNAPSSNTQNHNNVQKNTPECAEQENNANNQNINNISAHQNTHGYINKAAENNGIFLNQPPLKINHNINSTAVQKDEFISNQISEINTILNHNNQSVDKPTTSVDIINATDNIFVPPDCTSPKFDKLKQPASNTRQISSRLNTKKKVNVKEKCYLDQCESSNIHADANSIDDNVTNDENYYNAESTENNTNEENNQIVHSNNALNASNEHDDIPFVDEIQNNDGVCNKKKELDDKMNNLTINPTAVQTTKSLDSTLTSFNDRMKVSLPSQ